MVNKFLSLFPADLKINEVEKNHFQKYIDARLNEFGVQSGKQIKPATVYREIYLITRDEINFADNYESLKNFVVSPVPKPPNGYKRKSKRERLVTERDLNAVVSELIKEPSGKQTFAAHFARVRLAPGSNFSSGPDFAARKFAD